LYNKENNKKTRYRYRLKSRTAEGHEQNSIGNQV